MISSHNKILGSAFQFTKTTIMTSKSLKKYRKRETLSIIWRTMGEMVQLYKWSCVLAYSLETEITNHKVVEIS